MPSEASVLAKESGYAACCSLPFEALDGAILRAFHSFHALVGLWDSQDELVGSDRRWCHCLQSRLTRINEKGNFRKDLPYYSHENSSMLWNL